ncbi:MAG TPA: FtsH protease activity modulator HflK [Usitatibacteraceae bacterium]|nr:FtsH protease activity modulator HflK [Usitatibacteraceae bacterium]
MPPNDPQWGKRPNDGPPDLDEILRKLQQKLSGLFGNRRPSGPSEPSPPSGMPSGMPSGAFFGGSIAFIALLIVGVWLASGFYIVEEGRRGVVLRLGKYIETTAPGPRWHIPFPIESAEVVNVSGVRTVEVGYRGNPKNKQPQEALMLTDDENIVDVQFAIQYTLKGPEDYLFTNRNPDDNVLQAAETAIREVVGKSKMDFVLSQGRTEVASRVKVLMQSILDRYKTGINITTVNLQNVQAPEQVIAAFEDVVRAGQDRERFKNEGQAYANNVVPNARGVAARLTEEANGYKQTAIATAQGDASRFRQILAEYEKAPQVTRERLYLESMQQILSNTTKIVVDQKGGQNLLYLPLDKLMQMTSQQGATVSAQGSDQPLPRMVTPAESPVAAPAAADTRGRDALRSRDR